VFVELGGLDEHLAGAQRDVDFCLRARQAGYAVVSTPYALLSQEAPESEDLAAASSERYGARWRAVHERGDPYYNPNLTVRRDDYSTHEEPLALTHAASPLIDHEGVRKVLVVRLDHLGDVLLTVTAIRRLHELFPEAEITALVGSWARPLLEAEPC